MGLPSHSAPDQVWAPTRSASGPVSFWRSLPESLISRLAGRLPPLARTETLIVSRFVYPSRLKVTLAEALAPVPCALASPACRAAAVIAGRRVDRADRDGGGAVRGLADGVGDR